MQLLRLLVRSAAFCLALCLVIDSAIADDSFLSRLNPFSSTPAPKTPPFPGFSNHVPRQPAPSLLSRTFSTVGQTTKTAWNKTTNFLSPRRWFSSSTPNSSNKYVSTSSTSSGDAPKTVGEWLKQKQPQP